MTTTQQQAAAEIYALTGDPAQPAMIDLCVDHFVSVPDPRAEAADLYRAWVRVTRVYRGDVFAEQAEREAFDRLVDFLDDNDLAYSEYDPRP